MDEKIGKNIEEEDAVRSASFMSHHCLFHHCHGVAKQRKRGRPLAGGCTQHLDRFRPPMAKKKKKKEKSETRGQHVIEGP